MQTNSLKLFLYKACSRCHGDLVLDEELSPIHAVESQVEYVCVQCGHRAALSVVLRANDLAATAA